MITGARPFAAESPLGILERVRNAEPSRPSALNKRIPKDLETICLKCLAKGPAARYDSTGAFADDLDRWLRGETILARPPAPMERPVRWVRRHPLKALLAGAIVLAVLGPLLVGFYFDLVVVPETARTHPILGYDPNIGGFALTFYTGRVDRTTMNFDTFEFRKRPHQAVVYFTNVPSASLPWTSNLECQVMADIPGADDSSRSPKVRPGQIFMLERPRWRDRAYYVKPFGWEGQDVLARAPDARLVISVLDGK
jgi:hypothetical protein